MSKKKSYMNQSNLIAEGFFSKLGKMLGLSSKEENPKIKAALKDYNNSWKELENMVKDFTGDKKYKLPNQKFTMKDFL